MAKVKLATRTRAARRRQMAMQQQILRPTTSAERLSAWAARLGDNEPVFTLRARDITAPNTIRRWASAAAELGAPPEKVGDALRLAAYMETWQRQHGCKVPD